MYMRKLDEGLQQRGWREECRMSIMMHNGDLCFILMRCAWIMVPAASSVNENAPGRLGALLPTSAIASYHCSRPQTTPHSPPTSIPISPC